MKLGNVIPVLRGYVPCRKYDVLDDIDCENKRSLHNLLSNYPSKLVHKQKHSQKRLWEAVT